MIWWWGRSKDKIHNMTASKRQWSLIHELNYTPLYFFCFDSPSTHLFATRGRCWFFWRFFSTLPFVKSHLLLLSLALISFTNFLRGKRDLCLRETKKGACFFLSSLSLSDQTERHAHNTHRCSRETHSLTHSLSLSLSNYYS